MLAVRARALVNAQQGTVYQMAAPRLGDRRWPWLLRRDHAPGPRPSAHSLGEGLVASRVEKQRILLDKVPRTYTRIHSASAPRGPPTSWCCGAVRGRNQAVIELASLHPSRRRT